jgi:hypothetical protein
MNPDSGPSPLRATQTELLLLPDGRVLVHNLTAALAAVLNELSPDDERLSVRARAGDVARFEGPAVVFLSTEN